MNPSSLQDAKHRLGQATERLQQWDAQRPSLPAEHWLALGAGVWLFIATRRSPSMLMRLAGSTLASLLVVRAATGREGLERKPWLPLRP